MIKKLEGGLKVFDHDKFARSIAGVTRTEAAKVYETDHIQIGKLWLKKFVLEEIMHGVEQHKHVFDHATLVAKGRVRVVCSDGNGQRVADYDEGSVITITAGVTHHVLALTPGATVYCIHALDEE